MISLFKSLEKWRRLLWRHSVSLNREASLTRAGVALGIVSIIFILHFIFVRLWMVGLLSNNSKGYFFFPVAEPKDFVYSLDNVPHDWLFLQCKAVVSLRFNAYGICYCYFWLLYEARSFMIFIEESRNLIICGFIRCAGVCLCMTLCDSCIGS